MPEFGRFAFILLCAVSTPFGLHAEAVDPDVRKAILAGWAALEKSDASREAINATGTRIGLEGPDAGTSKKAMARFRRREPNSRISSDGGRIDEVVRNSRYVFVLQRQSVEEPWSLRFLEMDPTGDSAKKLLEGAFLSTIVAPSSSVLLGPFGSQQKKPSSLADDTEFIISKIESLPNGLIRIHYRRSPVEGEFECDPAANYVIQRGRCRHKLGVMQYDMTHRREFGPSGINGEINVEKLEYEVVSSLGSKFSDETVYSYPDLSKTGELDDERFRLSAYGLPEPEGVVWEKPRRWLPYWLAGAGLLIVVLTTFSLRRLRRARQEAKPA